MSLKFEFHIAKTIRKKYNLNDELFSITGNVIFADFNTVRNFVFTVNKLREPDIQLSPGLVNAAGLIDEIFHYLIREYENKFNPNAFKKAIQAVNKNLNENEVFKVLSEFCELFPPKAVYKDGISVYDYLNGYSESKSNIEIALEELVLLHFSNINPGNKKLIEFFNQDYFTNKNSYFTLIQTLELFFKEEVKIGAKKLDLFSFLKEPLLSFPDDLESQLNYMLENWTEIIGENLKIRILKSKDFIKEEIKFDNSGESGGEGAWSQPTSVPSYDKENYDEFLVLGKSGYKYAKDIWKDYEEPENFTADLDWMPNVKLIAKNSYVWLDQLSKKYNRTIKTLNEIPDEELDQLAKWNFNGLWLIGIWERSDASKKIKHILGNIDAVSSAYSLYDYDIAADLGGESAYQNLNERAKQRGIRLASDMVPNHTGIFSKWVLNHPEYFIQSHQSPFPNYRFTGPNLSDDSNYIIQIEDGYWSKKDAAVVFQMIDKRNGHTRFIYHGNDGTNMPWNDTAQLNLLNEEVRKAVIDKIFDVAKRFSIIRFDAAMTLTKRHFSRLWYPEPGSGGDIPSRTDHALTKDQFDSKFPEEFWREVVDKINLELPETLLLAEAFWLMEGYFVRSLGMHRVYNSAFMHMFMKEENEKYRNLITNTLEFEPEILKRYVNFMSNPDEETAIKQFGSDDKYFGVCLMMITLPGLPMFAHGQIEGYTEKYGMEYQRAYYNEQPNQWLVNRHENEIFPLMRKRYLFSEIKNFWIYDFLDYNGNINESVFAFTNSARNEKALILFNNKYDTASGTIKYSTKKLVSDGNNKNLVSVSLAESLGIKNDNKTYYIATETISCLEYLFNAAQLYRDGFNITLEGFESRVYLNFKEVYDENGEYENLFNSLNGSGVDNVEIKLKENILRPVHQSVEDFFNEKRKVIIKKLFDIKEITLLPDDIEYLKKGYIAFLKSIETHLVLQFNDEKLETLFDEYLSTFLEMKKLLEKSLSKKLNGFNNELHSSVMFFNNVLEPDNYLINSFWVLTSSLNKILPENKKESLIDSLMIGKPIKKLLQKTGKSEYDIVADFALINILNENLQNIFEVSELVERKNIIDKKIAESILKILENKFVKQFLRPNIYQGKTYYRKESFEELINWIFSKSLFELLKTNKVIDLKELELMIKLVDELVEYSTFSGYQIEVLESNLKANNNETKMRSK
ncbi:MAG: alpha-amylase family glycosyl hydrolase [Melioribacteraceae bacterium]|nr:alpha-amylase family glycosyl hydrolase [Melioribacteraceae bacterium]